MNFFIPQPAVLLTTQPRDSAFVPRTFRILLAGVSVAFLIAMVIITWRWPMIMDANVIRYANFLIAHGMAPYREVTDMSFPATYLVDSWVWQWLGPGDLAWRVFDFGLMGTLILAAIVIAAPRDWLGGLIGGTLWTALHTFEGPERTAERDQVIATLLLAACALVFEAVRSRRAWLMLPGAACVALAAGIKPTFAPMILLLSLPAIYEWKKRRQQLFPFLLFLCVGLTLAFAAMAHFLILHHATADFLALTRLQTAFYTSHTNVPLAKLLADALPRSMLFLCAVAVALACTGAQRTRNWEDWVVWSGIAVGAFSYLYQAKGFSYHRYPMQAFLLTWVCTELAANSNQRGWRQKVAIAALFFFFWFPLRAIKSFTPEQNHEDAFIQSVAGDLHRLGGNRLQHQVLCLDIGDGCLGALYRLGLVEYNGFTGDMLLFMPQQAPAVLHYRAMLWQQLQSAPPRVIVLADEQFRVPRGFDKLDRWPQFATFLQTNYTLLPTRNLQTTAYRLYVLKQ